MNGVITAVLIVHAQFFQIKVKFGGIVIDLPDSKLNAIQILQQLQNRWYVLSLVKRGLNALRHFL